MAGGQPLSLVLPPSKQPFLGRILDPAVAVPAGLEAAGLHNLVLDGKPLTPRRYQDLQGERQFAVLLQDPKAAQGTPSKRPPDSPNCHLAEPGVVLVEGCFRPLFDFLSLFDLALQPLLAYSLSYSLRILFSISAQAQESPLSLQSFLGALR